MNKRKIVGNIGENIGCEFIARNGFTVVDRNYSKKYGELDIVAKKDKIVHFFEVKSIVQSTYQNTDYKPEDNVHGLKIRKLRKIISIYLEDKGGGLDREFQFHVLCVYMNSLSRKAHVEWLRNVIL